MSFLAQLTWKWMRYMNMPNTIILIIPHLCTTLIFIKTEFQISWLLFSEFSCTQINTQIQRWQEYSIVSICNVKNSGHSIRTQNAVIGKYLLTLVADYHSKTGSVTISHYQSCFDSVHSELPTYQSIIIMFDSVRTPRTWLIGLW